MAGKEHWLRPREDTVSAKGKGELRTFWLVMKNANPSEDKASLSSSVHKASGSMTSDESDSVDASSEREMSARVNRERLVAWIVDILKRPLTHIVQRRAAMGAVPDSKHRMRQAESNLRRSDVMVIDEVKDVIMLPKYDSKGSQNDDTSVELSPNVISQLTDYVRTVALMYRDNPFHNIEHAGHVLMSSCKLLSRIVSPDIDAAANDEARVLHDHTYGITSDPLTQFSVILSALIHDLDHPGIPNTQLTKENDEMARLYNNKSIAEQHSIDAAWELLMEGAYSELRSAIYSNKEELLRFRQLTVNAVMATDIMDKELGLQRKARWNKAFSDEVGRGNIWSETEDKNRKATIIIEHLIQASDVAHTMQHWHIYKKWNERLFRESYKAFKEGRAEKNPLDGWYEGEIGFYDYYIIPLCKKLSQCGVFGVASDEYLNYAEQNRKEWVSKGKEVVAEYAAMVENEYP